MDGQINPNLTRSSTFSYKDILVRKLVRAVAFNIFSQILILILYVLFANISIFHPIEWIQNCLNTFTHFSVWLFVIIFSTIIFAQCLICAKDYVLMSSYSSTRFQQFLQIFSFHNFMLLTLHVVVGAGLVWQLLSLIDSSSTSLIVKCNGQYCLNTNVFFLLLGGFWTGFYYFIKFYIAGKHLVFPVIQQRKFLQFRSTIYPLLKDSFMFSFLPILYFSIFYFIWGDRLELQFIEAFGLKLRENNTGSLVYIYALCYTTIYFFTMNLMRFFFYLFLTEAVKFPLIKENAFVLTLQEALIMNNLPIVQNLACLDLFVLSQQCPLRRQFFFTLSQPGGHPHNWNALIENLLALFNDYTQMLQKSMELSVQTETIADNVETVCPPFAPMRLLSPIASRYGNLRNMSTIGLDELNVVNISHNVPDSLRISDLKQKFSGQLKKIGNFLKIVSGVNYFFGELPQANIQKCLGNGQLIIWASQGVSELAAASLTEDKYGIVQKDLPILITTLVHLKQSLDKLNKVPALSRRISTLDDFNYKMKNAVSAAVKRSLFNICLNFGEYFKDFPLKNEVLCYLQANIMLKNCN